jgi:DNA repair protein RecO (recombination protein O)
LRYFRHLQRSNWRQVENVVIPKEIEGGLEDLIQRYLTYLLERKLNSPDFMREIRNNKKNNTT